MKTDEKIQDSCQSLQTVVSDSILYQVVYGTKSHHHHTFEELRFHPSFFTKKEDAIKFIGKEKKSNILVSYFIFECF